MSRLPVIVGFGGINAAGRASFNHAYHRLVIEAMAPAVQSTTYRSLATLMRLEGNPDASDVRRFIDNHTLVREIEQYPLDQVLAHRAALMQTAGDGPLSFTLSRRHLPEYIPPHWLVDTVDARTVRITTSEPMNVLFPDRQASRVSSAGQVPTGFDPGSLYQSRSHPRALQLTVFGASDALRSTGIPIETLKALVPPDQFAVYSGSAMGQLDPDGYGGLLQNPLLGKRVTAKNVPLGLTEMPGDFINAYVLGSVGSTAGIIGACATFLYSVQAGVADIRAGRRRIVVVGNAEAPIVPEVIEGYCTMGALAEDQALMALDGRTDRPDCRRAARPFSDNCGFTVAEGAMYAVLMDDELALQLGARILGSVADVFVNADGYKKSIPGPGIGNYVSVGKAMGLARAILGEDGLRRGTHIQAHGTSTPQNRVTESHILSTLAGVHGIDRWPVGAVKAYVGHSMAPAGGDQLAAVLGLFSDGWLPGITTIDHIADDVYQDNLLFPMQHVELAPEQRQAALINSKGFGGNNATGLFLSPQQTHRMLERRWGRDALLAHARQHESVAAAAADYDDTMLRETLPSIYRFGEGVVEGADLAITPDEIRVPGFGQAISTRLDNPFPDMTD